MGVDIRKCAECGEDQSATVHSPGSVAHHEFVRVQGVAKKQDGWHPLVVVVVLMALAVLALIASCTLWDSTVIGPRPR